MSTVRPRFGSDCRKLSTGSMRQAVRPPLSTDAGANLKIIQHWIGGQACAGDSARRAPVWNPATGQQQAWVSLASAADVDRAVRVAAEAFEPWSQFSLSRRSKILFAFRELVNANANDLAELICDEHGKVLADALGEVQRGIEVVEFACGIPTLLKGSYSDQASTGVDLFSYREPLGVVAGITPFNFPAMVPMWMFPVAIACGNTFVLKPSERDPSAAVLLAELWAQAGLPHGVFNVVHGDREAVDALLDHPTIAAVSFVGSTPVAKHVHRLGTAAGKRVQALGGAKNHAVVLPDADLAFAADQLCGAGFGSAGERCMAISAVVAAGPHADALMEELCRKARAIRVGPGRNPSSQMGPVISHESKERIHRLIASGIAEGAELMLDGRQSAISGFENGFFVGPTILGRVQPTMEVYREEIFGPVLSVLQTDALDEAIALINSNPYGNGTAVFTSSGEAAREFQRRVKVGMIGVNVPIPVPMAYYSFGGWKASLFGEQHIHGPEGVLFNTRAKVVTSRWPKPRTTAPVTLHFPTAS
jgi:malonate-semialdehyde dehydrogenase (acetylating) / methylmalonate-semialdehyde dehydrogenase